MTLRRKHLLPLLLAAAATASPRSNPVGESFLVRQGRRMLNLGSVFGSTRTHAETPYERVLGHPVFQVTTPYGSSYMMNERLTEDDEFAADIAKDPMSAMGRRSAQAAQSRTISIFYMDPDDALAQHADLLQIDQMKDADIRIASFSLGKALRQSANLNGGLVTGAPIDDLTGKLPPTEEGGKLRYKILPPKRQLYYAARCIGKERVGLFGDNPGEDAATVVSGNSAIDATNIGRKMAKKSLLNNIRDVRNRRSAKNQAGAAPKTAMQIENAHMEGRVGIPVFYARGMEKQHSKLKHVVRGGSRNEIPLFFSYEDLQRAWTQMRNSRPKDRMPAKPTVEVFNLWDVLTSMDKDQWVQQQQQQAVTATQPLARAKEMATKTVQNNIVNPIKSRVGKAEPAGLQDIVFIPPSNSVSFKEELTRRGNGKARLRPMR